MVSVHSGAVTQYIRAELAHDPHQSQRLQLRDSIIALVGVQCPRSVSNGMHLTIALLGQDSA